MSKKKAEHDIPVLRMLAAISDAQVTRLMAKPIKEGKKKRTQRVSKKRK